MKVIDAIIALQQLDPNADLRLDLTDPNMGSFCFGNLIHFNEIETEEDGKFIVISRHDFEQDEEEQSEVDSSLN